MATNKNILKNWFRTGDKPLQEQFWNWMDSYWHKDESIPMQKVEGLGSVLGNKAEASHLQYYAKTDASNIDTSIWKEVLDVQELPSNVALLDTTNQEGTVYGKAQSDRRYYEKIDAPDDKTTYLLDVEGSAVAANDFGKVNKVIPILSMLTEYRIGMAMIKTPDSKSDMTQIVFLRNRSINLTP